MKLPPKETYELTSFLHTICKRQGALAVFANGWNDSLVAQHLSKQFGRKVTLDHVRYARQQNIGPLWVHKPKPIPAPPPAPAATVVGIGQEAVYLAEVTKRVKRLEELFHDLQQEQTKLMEIITRPHIPYGGANGSARDR